MPFGPLAIAETGLPREVGSGLQGTLSHLLADGGAGLQILSLSSQCLAHDCRYLLDREVGQQSIAKAIVQAANLDR